ncbi:MAG: hypothetical protein ACYS47_04400 [Planctomycetota bacterium]
MQEDVKSLESFYYDFNKLIQCRKHAFFSFLISILFLFLPVISIVLYLIGVVLDDVGFIGHVPPLVVLLTVVITLPMFFIAIHITLRLHHENDRSEKELAQKYPVFKKYRFSKPDEIFHDLVALKKNGDTP